MSTATAERRGSFIWPTVILLLLAAAVRTAVVIVIPSGLSQDTDAYRAYAETLSRTGVYGLVGTDPSNPLRAVPSAHRAPLYPLILSTLAWNGTVPPPSIAALHVLLGVATVWLTWVLAKQWGAGSQGWAAAVLVAGDPILCHQSVHIMTETLATFLAVMGLVVVTQMGLRRRPAWAALAGACIALGVLCRPAFVVWLVVVALAVLMLFGSWRRSVPSVLALLAGSAVVLAPWAVRNQIVFGRPVITTTHGGYTLLLANNPHFYQFVRQQRWGETWDSRPFDQEWQTSEAASLADPVSRDRGAYREALRNIRNQPGMFVTSSVIRVGRMWGLMPHRTTAREALPRTLSRYAIGIWYGLQMVLAVVALAALGRRCWRLPWFWGLSLCATLTAVHAVYWSNLRMRAPLMPVVYLLAAGGAAVLASRVKASIR